MQIEILKFDSIPSYDQLITNSKFSMFTHSVKYNKFLAELLPSATHMTLCSFEDDKLMAALPLMVMEGKFGTVINSLPYFGSHGGIVQSEDFDEIRIPLIWQKLTELCHSIGVFSCTIIDSPNRNNKSIYNSWLEQASDSRIGQITYFTTSMIENIRKNSLPNEFHSNRRDAIRRAENFGFRIQIDNSRQAFHSLYELHKSNMIGIGGKYKVLKSFELIQDIFTPDEDFNLWIAKEKDKIVAGLLVFYFKDTVEYWLPASHLDYKKHQPLSLIIWIAMKDSILRKRCRSWNWGGTWIDQKGVYDFKSRWGASDLAYNYYTRLFNKQKLPSQQFIHYTKQYPDFYVLPKKILEVPK